MHEISNDYNLELRRKKIKIRVFQETHLVTTMLQAAGFQLHRVEPHAPGMQPV